MMIAATASHISTGRTQLRARPAGLRDPRLGASTRSMRVSFHQSSSASDRMLPPTDLM